MSRKVKQRLLSIFCEKATNESMKKNKDFHESKIQDSRSLGGTSRVVLELKPFGISIRGLIGSKPWVGRSIGKMSRNSTAYASNKKHFIAKFFFKVSLKGLH